jgi:GAF domain-containing protein
LKARQSRLEALLRVSYELARIQPVESLLGGIAKTSGELFGANEVTFHLVEDEDLVLCGHWSEAPALRASPRLPIAHSLTGAVVASGEILVVDDPADDVRMALAHRESFRRQGVRAFLAAPVKIDDKVIGVLGIRTCRAEGFSRADVEMARALASQAAIALEEQPPLPGAAARLQ